MNIFAHVEKQDTMGVVNKIQAALAATSNIVTSLIKVTLLTRPTGRYDKTKPQSKELIILGNGPSLRDLLDNHRSFIEGKDLMAVNFASTSTDYTDLRPRYYLLMDPAFFNDHTTCVRAFKPMAERTEWPMSLIVPTSARRQKEWKQILSSNRHITVMYFNPTPIEGPQWFCHLCYRLKWGMPRPRNVLVACCMTALQLPYSNIYLAGADHSWMKEIWVDDNNIVQEDRAHFYDKGHTTRVTSPYKLYQLVESMAVAFRSYLYVEDYSKTLKKKIINISNGSYIDAFTRLNLD